MTSPRGLAYYCCFQHLSVLGWSVASEIYLVPVRKDSDRRRCSVIWLLEAVTKHASVASLCHALCWFNSLLCCLSMLLNYYTAVTSFISNETPMLCIDQHNTLSERCWLEVWMFLFIFYDVPLMNYVTGCEKESRRRMGSHIYKEKFLPILEISVTRSGSFEGVSILCH